MSKPTKLSELHDCQREGQERALHGEGKSAFYRTQIEKYFADTALVTQINAHLLAPSVDGDLRHPILNMKMFIFLIIR